MNRNIRFEPVPFYSDCVSWPRALLPALSHLVDEGYEITRTTFVRRTGERLPWPADSWWVSYWTLRGARVYWYVHSAIEYVYATPASIAAVHARAVERAAA